MVARKTAAEGLYKYILAVHIAAADTYALVFLEPFCLPYHGEMTCSAATFFRYGLLFMHNYNSNGSRCFEEIKTGSVTSFSGQLK